MYYLFAEMLFQIIYDQITTSSENRDCSAEQHTSPIFRIKAKDLFCAYEFMLMRLLLLEIFRLNLVPKTLWKTKHSSGTHHNERCGELRIPFSAGVMQSVLVIYLLP